MEMGMHEVMCEMNTLALHLLHHHTENSKPATEEKVQRWVKSGLESASEGVESGAPQTYWSLERPMQSLSPHPSFPSAVQSCTCADHAAAMERLPCTATVPAPLLGSGAWQQPGEQCCTWPEVARPASIHHCALDIVETAYLIFLASLWLSELQRPQDSLNCVTSLLSEPPHLHSVICPTENERDMERPGLEFQLCQLVVEVGLTEPHCLHPRRRS